MQRRSRVARVAPVLLVLVAFTLMALDHTRGERSPLIPLRDLAAAVYGPVERSVSAVAGAVAVAPGAYARIDELERENARLAGERAAAVARQTPPAAGTGGRDAVAARVVAVGGGAGYEDTVTIDAGSEAGVEAETTVVNADGLVGRVAQAGTGSAVVVLATDATTSLGARLEDTDEVGVVTGGGDGLTGAGLLRLRLLNSNARLTQGQRVVTLGSAGSRPYVPGVPIGEIVAVEDRKPALVALVRPFARYTALDGVAVLRPGGRGANR
ncbi:rod shape-determining protein MreC [Thermocatellispora tengchongensis]|uniref:Cell shape-determining protein MreC n=1 Tax=Thermocatellispora tengchongensis TaxID=1073253 RepID=A0A840PQ36_9ACTN|nr:rod shape-determining protein MreC [Thermocatellispora tengchongensis]MBB5138115.1 rod shape-determining protein MreC [Thermocatellispora tengchongensis]